MRKVSPFNVLAIVLGVAFLYLPIAILVVCSFNASPLVTVWGGWFRRVPRHCSACWRRWRWFALAAPAAA